MEVGPDICAAPSAGRAGEARPFCISEGIDDEVDQAHAVAIALKAEAVAYFTSSSQCGLDGTVVALVERQKSKASIIQPR